MLITIIIFFILYSNYVRFVELQQLTNVVTFKDYIKYSNYIAIPYNIAFIVIAVLVYVITSF